MEQPELLLEGVVVVVGVVVGVVERGTLEGLFERTEHWSEAA